MNKGLSSRKFPKLTTKNLDAIFSHVYDLFFDKSFENEENEQVKDFLPVVLNYAFFIYRKRHNEIYEIYGFVVNCMGNIFEINSQSTDAWMVLIMAIEELYLLTRTELAEILPKIKIRI